VDAVWEDRPSRPENPVTVHPAEFAGQSIEDKLSALREALKTGGKNKAYGCIVSMLDEVAWLFNLRGTDIPFNPVFFAYAIVTPDNATLFVDSAKLSDEVYKSLGKTVTVRPYEDVMTACTELGKSLKNGQKVSNPLRFPYDEQD
jgi:Xaa-Pro aminopeptidase